MTTGYEAGFYRDISTLVRRQEETNLLLARIAVAMEASLELVKQDMEIGVEPEL